MTPNEIAESRYEAARLERIRRKMNRDPDLRALSQENEKLRKELAALKAKPSKR